MPRKLKTVTIGGKRWKVKWVDDLRDPDDPSVELWGLCDYDTHTLTINNKQDLEEKADTIIHEMIHAIFPFLNEDAVADAATDIIKAFVRLGLLRKESNTERFFRSQS